MHSRLAIVEFLTLTLSLGDTGKVLSKLVQPDSRYALPVNQWHDLDRQLAAKMLLLLPVLLLVNLASAQRLTDAEELAFKDNVEDLCRGRLSPYLHRQQMWRQSRLHPFAKHVSSLGCAQ